MAAQPQRPRSTGLSDRRRGSFGVVPPLDESKVLRRYISTPKIGIRRPERRPQRELSFRYTPRRWSFCFVVVCEKGSRCGAQEETFTNCTPLH